MCIYREREMSQVWNILEPSTHHQDIFQARSSSFTKKCTKPNRSTRADALASWRWSPGSDQVRSRQILRFLKQQSGSNYSKRHLAVCQNPGTPAEHQNSWDLWMFIPLKMVSNRYWSIPISQKVRFGFFLAQLQRQTHGIHSSGLACRASTGINLPTCSATAAPALRSLKDDVVPLRCEKPRSPVAWTWQKPGTKKKKNGDWNPTVTAVGNYESNNPSLKRSSCLWNFL